MLAFILFALVSSITPGPTNIMVLGQSARYGLKSTPALVLGGCGGAAALVLAVGLGVGHSLLAMPGVRQGMAILGAVWLSGLALKLYRHAACPVSEQQAAGRVGLLSAAGLQLVNPKTWMMALAVVSVFAQSPEHCAWLALVFFLVSLPCMTCWALLGAGSARLLRSPRAMAGFNRCMALLLLLSTWAGVLL